MLQRVRWIRRLVRRYMNPVAAPVAEKWHRRLSFLYLFLAWNAFGSILYMTKTGRLEYGKYYGLNTEAESRSKAVEAMEMLGLPKARVITFEGLTKVRDVELINEALEEEKRLEEDDED